MAPGNEFVPEVRSGALIPSSSVGRYASDEAFSEISTKGGFLPRLMLMNATSELVQSEKMLQGRFALVRSKTDFTDLTKELVFIPVAWRPRAMEILKDSINSVFDHKSEEFKRIAKKSEVPNSQAMFGPEFLCWSPDERCFFTFYMASKTARRTSGEVRALIGKAVLLRSVQIVGKTNKWFGPIVSPSSAPVSMDDLPSQEVIDTQLADFNNPPAAVEVAEESGRSM